MIAPPQNQLRNVVGTVILVLLLALAAHGPSAHANEPPLGYTDDYIYYDTVGNVVGGRRIECNGSRSQWGIRTGRYDFTRSRC